jgi:hypothetical protein
LGCLYKSFGVIVDKGSAKERNGNEKAGAGLEGEIPAAW